jgi:hypothetical protein
MLKNLIKIIVIVELITIACLALKFPIFKTGYFSYNQPLLPQNFDCLSPYFWAPPEDYKDLDKFDKPLHPVSSSLKTSDDKNLRFELIANFSGYSDGGIVRIPQFLVEINADGFRDTNYSLEKGKNTKRIIAIGDSYTFGHGVNLSDSWPKGLEKLLNTNGTKYEVLNMGVEGYDMQEYEEVLKTKGLKYDPDIVLIGYVGNDIFNESEMDQIRRARQNALLSNAGDEKNKSDATVLADVQVEVEAYNKIITNLGFYFDKNVGTYLSEAHNLTSAKNITVIIANFMSPHQQLLENAVKGFDNFYVIDIMPSLTERARSNAYCRNDLIIHELDAHPNRLSHEIFSEIIYEFMLAGGLA